MTQTKRISDYFKLGAVLPLFLFGCASSGPKAELPSNANPNDEVARLKTDLSSGEANDFSVLDQKDFQASQEHLGKAEDKLKDNKDQASVLDELRIARGYYEQAAKLSTERRSHVEPILDARSSAVSAGAMQYPQSRKDLASVDQDAREIAESKDTPNSEQVMKLQRKYNDVQLSALESQNLGSARATINAAKDQDASSKAPKTYNQAKVDYAGARNAISTNRSSPGAYATAVRTANLSADTLAQVMEMARKNDKNFNEDEAVKIVWQERRIHDLDHVVDNQESQKNELRDTLTAQQKSLKADEAKVKLQKALQSAQDEFSDKEAEVYQQDNKLLIRLKSVGFLSGSAKLPPSADALLAKVQAVVEGLKPQSILIQGHTDSIGVKSKNEKLSEDRAEEVATYFEKNGIDKNRIKTEGFGDAKPLSTNKTKEGRAQNRRIDILVTPSEQM